MRNRGFLGIPNLPRKWNNGMVERWSIGFLKDNNHFNFIVNPAGGGTINPTLHRPLRAGSHHSNRTTLRLRTNLSYHRSDP
jgi:hypothetical protein